MRCTLLLLVFVALAGCSDGASTSEPAPSAVLDQASASVAGSAGVDDPPGTLACTRLAAALARASLMDAGVVDGVVVASSTAGAPVAGAADRLRTAYAAALASHGTDGEPDAVAAVSAAAVDMSGICADSGLKSVG